MTNIDEGARAFNQAINDIDGYKEDIVSRDVQIAQLKKLVKVQVDRIKQLEDEIVRLKSE